MVRHVGLEAELFKGLTEWSCAGCGTTNARTATLGCKTCSSRLSKQRKRKAACPDCGRKMMLGSTLCKACRSERCINGHRFDEKNTRYNKRGHRICRACRTSLCPECGGPMRRDGIRCQKCRSLRCSRGHTFTPETTYVTKDGRQVCAICQRARTRRYRQRSKS